MGDWNDARRGVRFRRVENLNVCAFFPSVVAGFGNEQNAFAKVHVLPSQREQLADAQARIKCENDAEIACLSSLCNIRLDLLLFRVRKSFYAFFLAFRANDGVGTFFTNDADLRSTTQGAFKQRQYPVHRVRGQTFFG